MANTPNAEDRLRDASQALVGALKDRTIGAADRKVTELTDRMEDLAGNGGLELHRPSMPHPKLPHPSMPKPDLSKLPKPHLPSLAGLPKPHLPKPHLPKPDLGKLPKPHLPSLGSKNGSGSEDSDDDGGSSNSNGSSPKVTTIIEEIDVGLPVSFVYDQWTAFGSFPSFMKKVENVDAVEDQRLRWKAQIWWSHREWEATILEQLPEERIVWRSEGAKGHVDGAVTFHELTPDLTRIILVLEYHPQGLFERTGNIWRAQGRRVRAELQHFRRHVTAHAVLEPDNVHGWRGVIEDGEVVEPDHEADQPEDQADEPEDEPEDEDEEDEDQYEEPDDDDEETRS